MAFRQPDKEIDRKTTTPFLLKLFYREGTLHRLDEFSPHSLQPPPPHLQIYTWPTCTLRELTHLLISALPSTFPNPAIGTRLIFRLIFPDTREYGRAGPGRYISKELGSVVVGASPNFRSDSDDRRDRDRDEGAKDGTDRRASSAGRRESAAASSPLENVSLEGDAEKTLQNARFVVGDFVACSIYPPREEDGRVVPPPPPQFRGGREYSRGDFGGRGGYGSGPRGENGFGSGGGYGGRGGRGGRFDGPRGVGVPPGEWRRGEVPSGGGGGGGGGGGYGGGYAGGGGGSGYGGRGRGRGRGGY